MLTPEQQEIRATGIGGSEIAAVAGLSPWMRKIDVWERKMGIAPRVDSFHTRRGAYLEPGLRDWYTAVVRELRGDSVRVTSCGTLRHGAFDRVLATPDGLVYDGANLERVLEIKSPGWRTADHWGEPGTDQVPLYYVPQATWEMACAGVELADFWVLSGDDASIYTVPYDTGLFGDLLEIAQRFWRDHIETRRPPDPDGSDSYSEHLARRFARPTRSELLVASPEDDRLAQEYRAAREAREAAELREKTLRQQLELRIGDAEGLVGAGWKITHREQRGRKSLDTKALAAEAPDLVAKHTRDGKSFRVFRSTYQGENT